MKKISAVSKAAGNYEIMFPVVEEVDELRRAVETVKRYNKDIRIGIMTETKRGVDNLRELLTMCDFVSIGTNDLTADVLGEDRQNAGHCSVLIQRESGNKQNKNSIISDKTTDGKTNDYKITDNGTSDNRFSEVEKYIKKIIDTTHEAGRKVCICGEAASDRECVERFITLGIDEISVRVWE